MIIHGEIIGFDRLPHYDITWIMVVADDNKKHKITTTWKQLSEFIEDVFYTKEDELSERYFNIPLWFLVGDLSGLLIRIDDEPIEPGDFTIKGTFMMTRDEYSV